LSCELPIDDVEREIEQLTEKGTTMGKISKIQASVSIIPYRLDDQNQAYEGILQEHRGNIESVQSMLDWQKHQITKYYEEVYKPEHEKK